MAGRVGGGACAQAEKRGLDRGAPTCYRCLRHAIAQGEEKHDKQTKAGAAMLLQIVLWTSVFSIPIALILAQWDAAVALLLLAIVLKWAVKVTQ